MSSKEILREIRHLSVKERLLIVEKTIQTIRDESSNMVEEAVELLYKDYKTDKELTAFTNLDCENFYEAR